MITYRETITKVNKRVLGDVRKFKRFERPHRDAVYEALLKGDDDALYGKPKRNPYPAGERRDAYERGYNKADPLGDWHGRNE